MNYTSVEQTKLQYAKIPIISPIWTVKTIKLDCKLQYAIIPIISPIWTVKTIKLDCKLFFAKDFSSFKLLVVSYLGSSRNNSKRSFNYNFLKKLKNKTKNYLNVIIP